MKTDYIFDENKKILSIIVDGIKVKPGFMRGFKKAQTTSYFELLEDEATFQNPYSGVERTLNALEATIYTFCMRWYNRYAKGVNPEVPTQTYDDLKYFLLDLNSQAYYDLLD